MITLEMVLVPSFLILLFFCGACLSRSFVQISENAGRFFPSKLFPQRVYKSNFIKKVLYIECLITLGFILGECIFIIATTILWKLDSPGSITVVVWKLSALFVNTNLYMKDSLDFWKKLVVILGYPICKFHKNQS